jgi:hypothetical protein
LAGACIADGGEADEGGRGTGASDLGDGGRASGGATAHAQPAKLLVFNRTAGTFWYNTKLQQVCLIGWLVGLIFWFD